MGVFGLVNTGLPLDQVFESRKRGAHIPFQTPFSSSPHIRKPIYHQKNVRNCSKPESDGITTKEVPAPESEPQQNGIISSSKKTSKRRQADSTDWVSSQLTRRFGIAGGLVWLGVLTFGVVSEQIKTRLEDSAERQNTKDVKEQTPVSTASGLTYVDKRIGGGAPVTNGFLIVLDYRATANGKVFDDTKERGKPIVFRYGARPFTGGLCQGVEEALSTMKAGGVRLVTVPPKLGFGDQGAVLRPTEHVPDKQGEVPPGATLEYELSLIRVSIPPS